MQTCVRCSATTASPRCSPASTHRQDHRRGQRARLALRRISRDDFTARSRDRLGGQESQPAAAGDRERVDPPLRYTRDDTATPCRAPGDLPRASRPTPSGAGPDQGRDREGSGGGAPEHPSRWRTDRQPLARDAPPRRGDRARPRGPPQVAYPSPAPTGPSGASSTPPVSSTRDQALARPGVLRELAEVYGEQGDDDSGSRPTSGTSPKAKTSALSHASVNQKIAYP